jgi:catechol 2,3-dioxygenase-like lactoylglutathione lyase family enzyme
MTDIIKRTTLMVRDATRAADWYANVFGMTRWLDTPFTLSGIGLAAGAKGDQTRLIIMRCLDPVVGMIGLLQWLDPPMVAPEALPTRVTFGMPIFVVAAEDVVASTNQARALGSRIHAEPYEWVFTHPDGAQKRMLGASFFDLDGYFYEVNQTLEVSP